MTPRAGLGVRAIARFVDIVLVMVPAFLILAPLILVLLPDAEAVTTISIAGAWIVVIAYEAILTARTGQTIGKRALGLRVVAVGTDQPPRGHHALERAAVPVLAGLVFPVAGWFLAYLWGWLWRWPRGSGRGLHDWAAGTEVVAVGTG